jgi:hypothetical protein
VSAVGWRERIGAALLEQQRAQAAEAPPPAAEALAEAPRIVPAPSVIEGQIQVVTDGEEQLRAAGYTEEGLATLRNFARQHGVSDLRIAAVAYAELHPDPPPVETGGSSWNFFAAQDPAVTAETSGLDLLLKGDDEGFLAVSVPAALREARRR